MTFTDSSDLEPTTFASGIEDGQADVTGPVDAAEVERILAEQYGIEVTPTLPTEIPTPSIPTPTLTVPSEVPSP